jgi:hypothetical protein
MRNHVVSMALVALVAGNAHAADPVLKPTLPGGTPRDALIITYMMADNNLSNSALEMLDALREGKYKPTAHSIVFGEYRLKRDAPPPNASDQDDDGNESIARLFALGDEGAEATKSPLAPKVDAVQSNSPSLMAKILEYAIKKYPGKRRFLHLSGHGAGAFGMGTDDYVKSPYVYSPPPGSSGGASGTTIPMHELAAALKKGGGGKPFEAVLFDSCMMGNIEALYELAGTVSYAVASQVPIWTSSWLTKTLPVLYETKVRDGTATPQLVRELAEEIANAVPRGELDEWDLAPGGFPTIAAVETAKLGAVAKAMTKLVAELQKALAKHAPEILSAYDEVPPMFPIHPGVALRDASYFIRLLTQRLKARSNDPLDAKLVEAVKKAAQDVVAALKAAMLYQKDDQGVQMGGLSLYMPERAYYDVPTLEANVAKLRFSRETGWVKLVQKLRTASMLGATAPKDEVTRKALQVLELKSKARGWAYRALGNPTEWIALSQPQVSSCGKSDYKGCQETGATMAGRKLAAAMLEKAKNVLDDFKRTMQTVNLYMESLRIPIPKEVLEETAKSMAPRIIGQLYRVASHSVDWLARRLEIRTGAKGKQRELRDILRKAVWPDLKSFQDVIRKAVNGAFGA